MSVSELPPIGNRTGSSTSRRSSRGSSSGGQVTRVTRFSDRPPLLSIDSESVVELSVMMNGRTATKRSHISPGSNGSSSPSQQNGTSTQHCSIKGGMSRAKSWCATEANAGPSPRLETLFERNGITQNGRHKLTEKTASNGQHLDRNSNLASKPPRIRLRSHNAPPTTTSSMQVGMRSLSNSISNLSKASDAPTGRGTRNTSSIIRNKSSLQNSLKFKSEQNLASLSNITPRNESRISRQSRLQTSRLQDRPQTNLSNFKPNSMRNVRSQPVLNEMHVTDDSLTTQNLRNLDHNPGSDPEQSDSDTERDCRIKDWLIGVVQAETPEPVAVPEENPPQTDTAIHIVYDKD